jgi:hypothetical protein
MAPLTRPQWGYTDPPPPPIATYLQSISGSGFIYDMGFAQPGSTVYNIPYTYWGSDWAYSNDTLNQLISNYNYQQPAVISNGYSSYSIQCKGGPSGGTNLTCTVTNPGAGEPAIGLGRSVGFWMELDWIGSPNSPQTNFEASAGIALPSCQLNPRGDGIASEVYIRFNGESFAVHTGNITVPTLVTYTSERNTSSEYTHRVYIGDSLVATSTNNVSHGVGSAATANMVFKNQLYSEDFGDANREKFWVQDVFFVDHLITPAEVNFLATKYVP